MSQRTDLLTAVARMATELAPDRIVRFAIDGVDGAGKTSFANELADVLGDFDRPVVRASVDGFHNPRAVRYARGRQSPIGFFEDSYNYTLLKQYLLDPLSPAAAADTALPLSITSRTWLSHLSSGPRLRIQSCCWTASFCIALNCARMGRIHFPASRFCDVCGTPVPAGTVRPRIHRPSPIAATSRVSGSI